MKFAVVVLCVAVIVVSGAAQRGSQDDDLSPSNVETLLRNPRVVRQQINCVLRKGNCNDIGQRLVAALPEVINRNCRACNAKQLANARRITSFIQQNYPQDWQAIEALYKKSG